MKYLGQDSWVRSNGGYVLYSEGEHLYTKMIEICFGGEVLYGLANDIDTVIKTIRTERCVVFKGHKDEILELTPEEVLRHIVAENL